MLTHCAADAMARDVKDALTLEETTHQLDIRGDGTGFFQSGFLFTSIHHWGSWFTLFPPWHESGAGDLRNGVGRDASWSRSGTVSRSKQRRSRKKTQPNR